MCNRVRSSQAESSFLGQSRIRIAVRWRGLQRAVLPHTQTFLPVSATSPKKKLPRWPVSVTVNWFFGGQFATRIDHACSLWPLQAVSALLPGLPALAFGSGSGPMPGFTFLQSSARLALSGNSMPTRYRKVYFFRPFGGMPLVEYLLEQRIQHLTATMLNLFYFFFRCRLYAISARAPCSILP